MQKITPHSRSRVHGLPILAALVAALLLLPLVASAAPGVDAGEQVQRVEVLQVDVSGDESPDGEVHEKVRVVVGSPHGEGDAKRFVWRGESQDGENFVWKNEDGQVIELSENHPEMFFSPGVQRGFLGVELTELTPELRSHFGAAEDRGVLIGRIAPDSPAARAGLRVGDVLTHIDGEAVSGSFDVTRRIGAQSAGDVTGLEVLRNGRVETLSATLEERERPQVDVRNLFIRRSEDGLPHAFNVDLDSEDIHEAMAEVRTYFDSEEWESSMEQMGEDLSQRMQELEVELEGLERKLKIEFGEDFEIDIDHDVRGEAESDPN